MDFSVYEAKLTERMLLYGIFSILLMVGFIACLFFVCHYSSAKSSNSKETVENKITQWVLFFLCIAGITGCAFLGGSTVWECSYDIKNQAYIVWEGNISVCHDGPTKSRWYLPDEGGIKLEGTGLDDGKYTGKVVYSEKTRVMLDYFIDEDQSSSNE